MLTSKEVKAVFLKHGLKVRVRSFTHMFRVVETSGNELDLDIGLKAMQELGLYNAFGEQDKFFTLQKFESCLYKTRFGGL